MMPLSGPLAADSWQGNLQDSSETPRYPKTPEGVHTCKEEGCARPDPPGEGLSGIDQAICLKVRPN